MDFALWTRSAVQGLIKELYYRYAYTHCRLLPQAVRLYSQKPVKRAYGDAENERMDG